MTRLRLGWLVLACTAAAACGANGTQQNSGAAPAADQQSQQSGTTGERQTAVTAEPGSNSVPRTSNTATAADNTATAEAPAPAQFKEVTIPAGTQLRLTLESAISSGNSKPEDPVRARLSSALAVDGTTAVPAGAEVTGFVVDAKQSGRVKGRGALSWRFTRLRSEGKTHDIHTAVLSRIAPATKRQDAEKIGIGAGAGALVGAIAGGKKGAAIGTAVGGGAGTGVVLATRGEEVELGAGASMSTTLTEPLTLQVKTRNLER